MTQKTNQQSPWILDVRVRERNLDKGLLTEKEVEKHLAGLPDVADQAESFATPQPATRTTRPRATRTAKLRRPEGP